MIFYAIVSSAGFARSRLSGKWLSANFFFSKSRGRCNLPKNSVKGCTTLWRKSSWRKSGVNQVRRDNVCSRGRSVGRRHQRKRCFRCGLANHTPDKCKYKDFECFNCHLTGHSLSVAMQNHHQKRWRANKMYITLNRIQKPNCRRTCEMNFSGPFHIFTAGHCRTDCMRWTMAAVRIYARYFPVIFLALFTSASILVDFSRLYKVFHLEEATLRVHQGSFSRLKRKLFFIAAGVLMGSAWISLFFSPR